MHNKKTITKRESWGSRIGVIFAMSGAAIGLGNLVRFPSQIAKSGSGGSFMIPYFVALIILGIPLLWVEWAIGRYGGLRRQGSLPMIFNKICRHPVSKYLGIFGLATPIFIASYYTWVTSWGLAYSVFSIFGTYFNTDKALFLNSFTGGNSYYFSSLLTSFVFYLIVLLAVLYILARGVRRGIETFVKIGMPLLFLFGIVLVVKVLTLGEGIIKGLSYIWEPNFLDLLNWRIWLLAVGQVFFTLSIGQGEMPVYASYFAEDDDIALGPLSQASLNEFCEVIIGSSIAIPAIFFFVGGLSASDVQGFNLAFTAMPMVIEKMAFGRLFGVIWFLLLFLAGLTTILALCQSFISFLEDSLQIPKWLSALIVVSLIFILSLPPIFWYHKGVFDDVDFWMGAFFLVIVSLSEVILFSWFFGIEKGFKELHKGAKIMIPIIFKYVIKYITPLMLIFLLVIWVITESPSYIMEANIYVWIERIIIIVTLVLLGILTYFASKKEEG